MVEKRLRYHLARGEFYKHWQMKRSEKNSKPVYFNPEDTSFLLNDVKLYSKRNVAQKIYEGENKTVCAWLAINNQVKVSTKEFDVSGMKEISYNPRVAPFWTYKNLVNENSDLTNLDMQKFDRIIINKTKIYVQ